MKLGRLLGVGLLARSVVRELRGVREQLERQNGLLERLAARFAPLPPPIDDTTLRRETGVSFLDADELALAEWYTAKVETEQGQAPTEEQILSFLADEKTVDLAARLSEREEQLQRLRQDRRSR